MRIILPPYVTSKESSGRPMRWHSNFPQQVTVEHKASQLLQIS
ncbi:3-oxoacyl-acyl-carrier-protein synthase [Mycobacterium pseudoshottsii JCM 15466]|nr:3-oxoacyl-acyl-carrier-protein synthase [Mycobacterium pseudoshottsii JCM 15466]